MSDESLRDKNDERRSDKERGWVSVYLDYCKAADALDEIAKKVPTGRDASHVYIDAIARGDFQLAECVAYLNIRKEPLSDQWRDRFSVARCAREGHTATEQGGDGDE